MANYDDRLKDYTDVKERIRLFYERHPDGRLVTADISMSQDPDGIVRVWAKAHAYRTPDDPLPGTGWSYLAVPGTTPYTRGSEVENAETSAWGRAIGATGIGIDKSIASANEIASKEEGKVPEKRPLKTIKPHDPTKSLIGKAELGKADSGVDWELHEGQLAFRLTQGNTGYKVVTLGPLAEQLATFREALMGQRVKVWGNMETEAYSQRGKDTVWYSVVHATKVEGADLSLPVEVATDANPEAVSPRRDDANANTAGDFDKDGLAEAPSEPLFDPIESARLDAEEAARGMNEPLTASEIARLRSEAETERDWGDTHGEWMGLVLRLLANLDAMPPPHDIKACRRAVMAAWREGHPEAAAAHRERARIRQRERRAALR